MSLVRYFWMLPFVIVLYIYGNEALGVFLGDPEHYEIVSGLGLSGLITTSLVWLSVVIEAVIIGAVFWKPTPLTFSAAALWPWVPRIISAFTGGGMDMMEMDMSFFASIAAMCAYMAYEECKRTVTPRLEYAEG